MKKVKKKTELIKPKTIYLTDIEFNELKKLASELNNGTTISNFIRILINDYKNLYYARTNEI